MRIGTTELLIILAIVILVFGPSQIPKLTKMFKKSTKEFKKGMALIDGHGNFGSIEGDGAAAMRYTEARLMKISQEVYLKDLDKDVVNFVPNSRRHRNLRCRNRPD